MGVVHAGSCDAVDFEDRLNVPGTELVMRDTVVSSLIELGTLHVFAAPLMHLRLFVLTAAAISVR